MGHSIAISQIAWDDAEEIQVASRLKQLGIDGVELTPYRVRNSLLGKHQQTQRYLEFWQDHGIRISAMQALLYGGPAEPLFGSPAERQILRDYLLEVIELGGNLGAPVLVFGSPGQRQRGELCLSQAQAIAVDFFADIAQAARGANLVFCIEPNPVDYGCDFINTVTEAIALVDAVGDSGFGLHVDAGALRLNAENIDQTLAQAAEYIRYFHISEPHLQAVGDSDTHHQQCAAALNAIGYNGWRSVEMRRSDPLMARLDAALHYAQAIYQ